MDTYLSICSFHSLPPATPYLDNIRNQSTLVSTPPLEIRKAFIHSYKETYEYMKQAFPAVQSLWSKSFALID